MRKLPFVLLLIAVSMIGAMLACGSPTQLVTLNLKENDINTFLQQSGGKLSGEDWKFSLESVDLHDGFMRLNGSFQSGNQPENPGSIDLRLSVVDGELQVEVINSDFGNVVPGKNTQTILEQRIQDIFSEAVSKGKQGIEFVSIEMLEDLLKVQLRFLPQPNN
jgi:hypothetical protein